MNAHALALLLASSLLAHGATTALPERLPEGRYSKLRTQSPFAVATAVEKTEEVKISWAQNLYLGSVAKVNLGGADKEWVIIKDRTQPGNLINLFGNDPNAEGYQLVKLEWSEDPKKTKATVKKGGEFATLEPDQAAFTSTAPAPAARPGQPPNVPQPRPGQMPGVQQARPGQPPGMPLPNSANSIRPPATLNRPPTIPRPTNVPPAVTQPQPKQQGSPNVDTRKRIRVINSNP
jgi:hypothetical protein